MKAKREKTVFSKWKAGGKSHLPFFVIKQCVTFTFFFSVILTDNGRCFKDAMALEYTKNGSPRTKIFYCDPQASWQKPHIEKNHEFIRYVIPRGKTFKGYTQEDMTLIANHINSTTRPGLGYKSSLVHKMVINFT